MKLSNLKQLLCRTLPSSKFRTPMSDELHEYEQKLSIRGSTVPIYVDEDQELTVSIVEVKALCELFVSGELTATELAYVADALQLSEKIQFSEERVTSLVDEMTDPEVNGPFTETRAKEILALA